MNSYLKNLSKIEFVVSYACTGRCIHCSEGDHELNGERIEPSVAADAVCRICRDYDIKTVMAFGGEPLLYVDAVYAIMQAALESNVPLRQIITNGYFTSNVGRMREVAERLSDCGVNDLLLSVDAFHQQTIPLETVRSFAIEAKRANIPMRLQPAWLVSRDDNNSYNKRTREILESLSDLSIAVGEGNVVFPEGNAARYLAEFFVHAKPENPYETDPYDVRCISFSPNGDVLGANAYTSDVIEILENYTPSMQ